VLGPATAPLGRLKGEHRLQILLKTRNRRLAREALDAAMARLRPCLRASSAGVVRPRRAERCGSTRWWRCDRLRRGDDVECGASQQRSRDEIGVDAVGFRTVSWSHDDACQ